MKNPVNWFEIPTTDIERANNFYKQVFAVETVYLEIPGTKMYMMMDEDQTAPGAGGAIVEAEGYNPNSDGVVIYFSCEDLNNELSRVESAGGKVLFPKMDIGEFGNIAHFIDTEGNRIGLHSQK
jgi:hypothetical protein